MKYLVLLFLSIIMLTGCVLDQGGGSGTVSGTITNTGAYSNLKIGFFEKFGTTSDLDDDDAVRAAGGRKGYLYYSDAADDSAVTITPAKSSAVTSGSYSFTLPSNPQISTDAASFYYYLAVWSDADNDDFLDLLDVSVFDTSAPGEYSRLPLRDLGGTDPAYIRTWYYQEDDSFTGYKYNGYDGVTNYAANQLTGTESGGFNFELD